MSWALIYSKKDRKIILYAEVAAHREKNVLGRPLKGG